MNMIYFHPKTAVDKHFGLPAGRDYKNKGFLDEKYKTHKAAFEIKETCKDFPEDFYDNAITSLLYYGEIDEVSRRYRKYVRQSRLADDESQFEEEFDKTSEGLHLSAFHVNTKPVDAKTESVSNAPKSVGFRHAEKEKEKTGYSGEWKVYEYLLGKYKNVNWVSENAKKANVNPTGSAGYGYDMMYTEDDGHVVYVEVKTSTSGEITFYLSDDEYEFARNHEGNYIVVFVPNVNSSEGPIYMIDNLIVDGAFNTDAFSVRSDTKYLIKCDVEDMKEE